jgi:hypothetical protein
MRFTGRVGRRGLADESESYVLWSRLPIGVDGGDLMPSHTSLRARGIPFSRSASKHLNNVILGCAKNLVFSIREEILRGVYPELNDETLRFTQGDKAKGSG